MYIDLFYRNIGLKDSFQERRIKCKRIWTIKWKSGFKKGLDDLALVRVHGL